MTSLHLDFETFSRADLKKVGSARYAFDPSTTILCAAMAIDDEEPEVFCEDVDCGWMISDKYKSALINPDVEVWAHHAQFEMFVCQALLEKTWDIPCPALNRFRCTLSLARRAALPGSLDKLGEVLNLQHLKDKRGKSLINKFSVMQKPRKASKKNPNGLPARRIMPQDEPEAFAEFMAYCAQDIRAEKGVKKKLFYFSDPINNANYSLDAVINARGVPVNLTALRHAQTLVDEETALVSARFRELTGFEPTQGAVFLQWLHGKGAHLDDLQAETIETYLDEFGGYEDDPQYGEGIRALRMKQSIAYASIKKIATMLACAGPHDNRIRGMLNHHGATTGRWTASLVQFQNMKRATVKESEAAYRDICNGISREMLELTYGPVLEVISSCIRHFVHDTP